MQGQLFDIWARRWRVFTLVLFFSSFSANAELPSHNSVPGGVAVVPLGINGENRPKVQFGQNPVLVTFDQGSWHAVIGLPQDILPGKYLLTIMNDEIVQDKRYFRVAPLHSAKEQRTVTLPDHLHELTLNSLSASDLKNVNLGSLSADITSQPVFKFQQMVAAGSYIPFGRVIKMGADVELIDHPWITYITEMDEIVRSPGKGIVDRIFLSEYSGIAVVLHHGRGLKSVVNHIHETILKPGENIEAGDVIGTAQQIGKSSSGRVDWYLLLNDAYIDPIQFTSQSPSSS